MMIRPRGYLVCSTPRSGSTYLCQLLESTGRLGKPREYFNAVGRRNYDGWPDYPDDAFEQLTWLRRHARTRNGVYGLKLHPFQLRQLPAELDLFAELPRLRAIRVIREDRLAQAISWSRAKRSGAFRISDVPRQVEFDAAHVQESLQFVEEQTAAWERVLVETGLPSMTLSYEQIEAEPQAAVNEVARFLGVRRRVTIDPSAVVVRRQRDAVTDEWRSRYLAQ